MATLRNAADDAQADYMRSYLSGGASALIGMKRRAADKAGDAANAEARSNNAARSQASSAQDGSSPEAQSQAAWEEAMKLLKRDGPYTPQVTQQLVNRQADQSAAAEGVNADAIRNDAAARGLDVNDPGVQAALRQGQTQRQQSNIAFQGDMGSRAAVGNFNAQTPGLMTAAQALMNRQFGDQRQSAVQGGGVSFSTPQQPQQRTAMYQQPMNTAFAGTQPVKPTPQVAPAPVVDNSVAARNAKQAAWDQRTNYGRSVYGAGHRPGQGANGRDPVTGNLVNPTGTLKPNTSAPPKTAFSYGSVKPYQQTFGFDTF